MGLSARAMLVVLGASALAVHPVRAQFPEGLADSTIVPDSSRYEALLSGLSQAEAFRRSLLRRPAAGGASRAERLANLIDRFLKSDPVGLSAAGCSTDAILDGLLSANRRDVIDLMNAFAGEWHGWWDTMQVHHHWTEMLKFDPPIMLGTAGTRVRALQYAWVGDGFGWNVLAEGETDSAAYILGTVYHIENGDPAAIRLHRPHVGVLCGRGQLIWITDGEVFLERIRSVESSDERPTYLINGFDYRWQGDRPVWKDWFETAYAREPGGKNHFTRFDPAPE